MGGEPMTPEEALLTLVREASAWAEWQRSRSTLLAHRCVDRVKAWREVARDAGISEMRVEAAEAEGRAVGGRDSA
jgi:hypothetical protein